MLSNEFTNYLSNLIGSKIIRIKSVSGGDISAAYTLETSKSKFFLKVNSKPWALDMFQVEAQGLTAINNSKTIATPEIIAYDTFKNASCLIIEFVESKLSTSKDLELFGSQLAQLHQVTTDEFGFANDNFIGSLHQSNNKHKNWNDFYIEERLNPQFELARSKGLLIDDEIPETQELKEACFSYFNNVKPSLLHGDLWSGNYLISASGRPYLIDPAIYFGHSEVDIAMSQLFGGFGTSFYESYHTIITKDENTEIRIELYQLYYLLIHLNLFGSSYYGSVKGILSKYF
ncbi:MAG: fructosamine kinase family protein [Bacteroidia bacterium]|nr:fructosamine kinase family protein [Bacteroidia bacterium]